MKRKRMTKADRRRQSHRANATTYFRSTSDGMRQYYRGRRPDAFLRRRRIRLMEKVIAALNESSEAQR